MLGALPQTPTATSPLGWIVNAVHVPPTSPCQASNAVLVTVSLLSSCAGAVGASGASVVASAVGAVVASAVAALGAGVTGATIGLHAARSSEKHRNAVVTWWYFK